MNFQSTCSINYDEMESYNSVLNILLSVGASQEIIDRFLYEEIDMVALRLLQEEHYAELGCPVSLMISIQLILNTENLIE